MSSERRDASGENLGPAVTATRERLDEVTRQSIERRVEAAERIAEPLYKANWDGGHDEVDIDPDMFGQLTAKLRTMHLEYREWIEEYCDARWAGEEQPDLAMPPPRPIIETINVPSRMRVRGWLAWTRTGWHFSEAQMITLTAVECEMLGMICSPDAVVMRVLTEDELVPVSDDGVNFRWE